MFITHAFAEQVYCDIFCILGTVFGRTQIHYLTHYSQQKQIQSEYSNTTEAFIKRVID